MHKSPAAWRKRGRPARSPNRSALRRRASAVTQFLAQTHGSPDLGNKKSPLDELVYILLSQVTTLQSQGRVYDRLRAAVGRWDEILTMPLRQVRTLIRDAGLSRQRAVRLRAILRQLRRDWGHVTLRPLRHMGAEAAITYLSMLPGIGDKTAACIVMYSLGGKVLPVDRHVRRVAARLGLLPPGVPLARARQALEAVVAPSDRYPFHVNAVAHGRIVCIAGRPRCHECPLCRRCPTGSQAPGRGRMSQTED